MTDIREALRDYLEASQPVSLDEAIDGATTGPKVRIARQHRPLLVAAVAATVVVLLVGGAGLLTRGDPGVADDPIATTQTVPTATTTTPGPAGTWNPILANTQAKPAPPAATCPPGADPNTPGPAGQGRPRAEFNWHRKAVFDRHAGRIVYVDVAGETWTFDVCTSTWQNMNPEGAPFGAGGFDAAGRPDGALGSFVYDVDSDVTVAFGYEHISVYDANTNTWTQLDNDTGSRGLAYDPVSGLILTTDFVGRNSRFPAFDARWQLRAYDVDTNQWFQVADIELDEYITGPNTIEGFSWFGDLLGYSENLDRLIIAPGDETTVLVDPRTGDTTLVATPTPYVNLAWPSGIYEPAADTVYTKSAGEASVCGFDTSTLAWSTCFDTPNTLGLDRHATFAEMVGDPINQRLILISGIGNAPPYETTLDVWAIDLNTGEWIQLLAPAGQ